MSYRHDRDAPKLRSVLVTLTTVAGLKQKALLSMLDREPGSQTKGVMSLSTFRRFIKGVGAIERIDVVEWIWDFLHADPKYCTYFDDLPTAAPLLLAGKPEAKGDSREEMLSEALQRFVFSEKPVSPEFMESLCSRYPGRYVMYRADLRPLKRSIDAPPRFRASYIDISLVGKQLIIKELQNYPKSKWEGEFFMKTTGVMVPYGKYILFIAQALVRESFRFGVIDKDYSFTDDYKVSSFQGSLLVASSEDLFPSTPFFCQRDDGKLKTGLILFKEITSGEARACLADAHRKAAIHYKTQTVIKP